MGGAQYRHAWRDGKVLVFGEYLCGIVCVSGEVTGFHYEFEGEGDDIRMGK